MAMEFQSPEDELLDQQIQYQMYYPWVPALQWEHPRSSYQNASDECSVVSTTELRQAVTAMFNPRSQHDESAMTYWTRSRLNSYENAFVNRTDDFLDKCNQYLNISEHLSPGPNPCKVAVEAAHYLQQLIDQPPTNEPLLSALGGFPLALKKHIESDLAQWKDSNLIPFFIFEGMSTIDREEKELKTSKEATNLTNRAWGLYTDNKATAAVTAFGRSGAIKAKKFVRFFQEILLEQNLEFMVAPYSACAQIAYFDSLIGNPKTQYVDAIMGSYELLLFKVESIITRISFEEKAFSYVSRATVSQELNLNPTDDLLVDALLCTGMYGIPPFPPLAEGKTLPRDTNGYDLKAAVLMLKTTSGRTVGKMCESHMDKMTHPDWEVKYQKAKMGIIHNVVLSKDGKIFIHNYDALTADNHEYLGLQLPEELVYYLNKAAIAPRILNWLGSLHMLIHPPLDGGDSEEYKLLVSSQLVPIRQQTVALLASKLNRAFQHKNLTMKFWLDDIKPISMNPNQVTPRPADLSSTWCVKESQYSGLKKSLNCNPGSITFALRSVADPKFAALTTKKQADSKLSSDEEIICNTLWRYFHLRGYINDKHELTNWGKALLAALQKSECRDRIEEAIVLAFELIRHDQLNTRNRYEDWIGGTLRGSEEDKADCLLIARVSCLAKIRHKPIGYTGPLSRNLLAFHSVAAGVRESARDLIETIYVSILLNNEAERQSRRNYASISLKLPFWHDVDCALGIAVKTYLDDHAAPNQSEETKNQKKRDYAGSLIPHHVDFASDLNVAYQLFDSIYAGIQTLTDEVPDKSSWDSANQYLAVRR